MPAFVKVLIEGYTNADFFLKTGDEKSCSSVVLVKDKNIIMVVDPGTLLNPQVLISELAKENLKIKDVNFVFVTHSHIDHYRNIGMFPDAKIVEFFGIWQKNNVKDWQEEFSENIKIIKTPGHDYTSLTLLVKTQIGNVVICGDVFWKKDSPEVDVYAQDLEKLYESRNLVLNISDFIIPGHGPMYKVDKEKINRKKISKIMVDNKISIGLCKKCRRPFRKIEDKCLCQEWLCYRCCECESDCDLCNCKHKLK